uniref:Uncharacterized protein n=1 Tax=Manihot esculenta TaxID=3983 RepID=A0A2C9TZR3_MANES
MSQAWQLGERKGEGKGNCEHLGKRSRSNKFAVATRRNGV